jgi:hypothetical protein
MRTGTSNGPKPPTHTSSNKIKRSHQHETLPFYCFENDGAFVFIKSSSFVTGTLEVTNSSVWPGEVSGGACWYTLETYELFLFRGYAGPNAGCSENNNLWSYNLSLG